MLEEYAGTIDDWKEQMEFERRLRQAATFDDPPKVTSLELERAFTGSRVRHLLDQFFQDRVWLRHFDPQRDMRDPTVISIEPTPEQEDSRPNCLT